VLDLGRTDGRADGPGPITVGVDARSRAAGYELVGWRGATPDEHLGDLAVLVARMSTDPPLGDLVWEPEAADPVRLRAREVVMDDRGYRRWTTAARPIGGPLVGFTQIIARASQHEDADQGDTIVLTEHRGHRLGALMKQANLALVRADLPALRRVWTWNAAENAPMVAVNEAMGFRRHRNWYECQLRLP
jgi:RimJ/RimL family protein N-acetyltransferase